MMFTIYAIGEDVFDMRILFLDTGSDSSAMYFREQRNQVVNCESICLYKPHLSPLFKKALQFIGVHIYPPILWILYGEWKKTIGEYDMFIVSSRKSSKYAIKYIKKKSNKRVVVWYWNIVTDKEVTPAYCKKINCEPWTFDKDDAAKYQMKFGDTYYFDALKKEPMHHSIKYDVFYVGVNKKGRESLLNAIKDFLNDKGRMCKFHLVDMPNTLKRSRSTQQNRLSYLEILMYLDQSLAILDLNRVNQSGMTLRPLEALYLGKKLITNNQDIVNYKGYVEKNTYIIKNHDFDGLEDFLSLPIETCANEIIDYYKYSTWLQRIIDDREA